MPITLGRFLIPLTACPPGWNLPTDEEWTTLTGYLTRNGYGYGGSGSDIGKSMASTSGWAPSLAAGTIGNDREGGSYGGGYQLGGSTYFWSASEDGALYAWIRSLSYSGDGVYRGNNYYGYERSQGFSVRCLQN